MPVAFPAIGSFPTIVTECLKEKKRKTNRNTMVLHHTTKIFLVKGNFGISRLNFHLKLSEEKVIIKSCTQSLGLQLAAMYFDPYILKNIRQ